MMKRIKTLKMGVKKKLSLAFLICCLISIGSLEKGFSQDVVVLGDLHGVAPFQKHRTLAKIILNPSLPQDVKRIDIRYSMPTATSKVIEGLSILVSDSLVVRDLPDYKGRVRYDSFSMPKKGNIMSLSAADVAGRRYLYVVADIGAITSFTPNDSLSIRIEEVAVDGIPLHLEDRSITSRRLHRAYQPLFVPGDSNSRNYRIPAILKTSKGTLIAVADKRKYNQGDLPEDIDIVMRRSSDGGDSWTEVQTIVRGEGRNAGFGDAALVETKSGKLLMIFVGGVGLWQSTSDAPQRTYISESLDDGLNWSAPRDITHYIFGKDCVSSSRSDWQGSFCASGKGLVLPSGRIMFVAAIRESAEEYSLNNYVLYSDDEGATWKLSDCAFRRGDESKLTRLRDGRLLMSIRNQGAQENRQRFFAISTDEGQTWKRTDLCGDEIHDPGCNGAFLYMNYRGKEILLHSLPFGPGKRQDGVVYAFDLDVCLWTDPMVINRGPSAYSDIALIDEDTIGYFVEEDEEISLVFIRLDLGDLFHIAN